jgi:hypothetical protein
MSTLFPRAEIKIAHGSIKANIDDCTKGGDILVNVGRIPTPGKRNDIVQNPASQAHSVTHNDNSTHIDNSIHNDNSTHTHVHYHINFGQESKEDLAFLTPELVDELVKAMDAKDVLNFLVLLIHFNPHKKENMNIFALNDIRAYDKSTKCFTNNRWEVWSKQDLAAEVVKSKAKLIVDQMKLLVDQMKQVGDQENTYRLKDSLREFKNLVRYEDSDATNHMLRTIQGASHMVKKEYPEVMDGVQVFKNEIFGIGPLSF